MSLLVGHIPYLNCAPFFHHLPDFGFSGRLVRDVPTRLNALLAAGRIDVAPASSFEYGCRADRYRLLPALSISSMGAVQSVLLLASDSIESLRDGTIAVTDASATSVALLRVLLREWYGWTGRLAVYPTNEVERIIAAGGAGLLIGDRALRAGLSGSAPCIYDLGQLWHEYTGLPFVFALWIVHQRAAETKAAEIQAFAVQLQASLQRSRQDYAALARHLATDCGFNATALVAYWKAMSFQFGETHRQGLELFFRLAVRHGLLPEAPPLCFFGDPFSVDAFKGIT
ncbi:menaquinone biosynthesis protein [Desulfuromonas sp. CSMB_57]|uniref:menaquinone biosynthetic enzyme MqnA/MqnD family protein n=1 Tax=Desulfuromonas sp. CSMB_57 TaxID=2807629 RepID=UPI0020BDA950|nr:menaquinone biosynthesis protein [Desulfuromonas sp. CSMB_57]